MNKLFYKLRKGMEFERKSDEICMYTNCKRLWDTMDYIRIKWLLVCEFQRNRSKNLAFGSKQNSEDTGVNQIIRNRSIRYE